MNITDTRDASRLAVIELEQIIEVVEKVIVSIIGTRALVLDII
jgi:hypothetical protein